MHFDGVPSRSEAQQVDEAPQENGSQPDLESEVLQDGSETVSIAQEVCYQVCYHTLMVSLTIGGTNRDGRDAE